MRDRKGAQLVTGEGASFEGAGLDFVLRQEGADFFHEPGPGGFVLEDEMVLPVERVETRVGDLSSPVGAFVRERCEVAPGLEVDIKKLFEAWKSWCEEQGRDYPGTAQTFGRDLHAVVPSLKTVQRRKGEKRPRFFEGIDLAS